MVDKYSFLRSTIKESIEQIESPLFGEVSEIINQEMASLCEGGKLFFENDYTLTGFSLECRVKNIFNALDFQIFKGRTGMEDFTVKPPVGFKPTKPLVLEVKSSRKQNISRDQLRQLDDWVFELSGEQQARKYGLQGVGGIDYRAIASNGMLTSESAPRHHPTPHKGVFIFNGPVGTQFNNRKIPCLSPNDEDFVNSRDFCILPFNVLVECSIKYEKNSQIKKIFWEKIHETSGVLTKL